MKLRLRKIKGSLSVKNERAAMPIWKMSLVKRQNNIKRGGGADIVLDYFMLLIQDYVCTLRAERVIKSL